MSLTTSVQSNENGRRIGGRSGLQWLIKALLGYIRTATTKGWS